MRRLPEDQYRQQGGQGCGKGAPKAAKGTAVYKAAKKTPNAKGSRCSSVPASRRAAVKIARGRGGETATA